MKNIDPRGYMSGGRHDEWTEYADQQHTILTDESRAEINNLIGLWASADPEGMNVFLSDNLDKNVREIIDRCRISVEPCGGETWSVYRGGVFVGQIECAGDESGAMEVAEEIL